MERNAEYIKRLARQVVQQKKQIRYLKLRLKIAEESLSADNRQSPEEALIKRTLYEIRAEGTD